MTEKTLNLYKQEIVKTGKKLYQKGLIVSTEGNISVKVDEKLLLTTPGGVNKGLLTTNEVVETNLQGIKRKGALEPSSELRMHLAVYRVRSDVNAAVHAHPPVGTGFAVAGLALDKFVLPEVVVTLGTVPLIQYATPTTDELAELVADAIRNHDALLLANHGALTVGRNLLDAYHKMETLEQFARISLVARLLGHENTLSQRDVDKLMKMRTQYLKKFLVPSKG
jgi:L-fuculose-phosphate aldolase